MPDSASEGPAYELNPHYASLRSATVSPAGDLALTWGHNGPDSGLMAWNLGLDAPLSAVTIELQPGAAVQAARFSADGDEIVAATLTGSTMSVMRWPASDPDTIMTPGPAQLEAAAAAMSRSGGVVACRQRTSGLLVSRIPAGNGARLGRDLRYTRVAVSPSGSLIAAVAADGRLEAYDLDSLALVLDEDPGEIRSMDCTDSAVFVTDGASVRALSVTMDGPAPVHVADPVRRIAVGSAGPALAVALDKAVLLIDAETGTVVSELRTPAPVSRMTFGLTDNYLVTAHEDGIARLWRLPAEIGPAQAVSAPDPQVRYGQEPAGRDFYTLRDSLGYEAYADAIAAVIRHPETVPPLTIGIKGAWGAGKTSLMRMVQARLEWPLPAERRAKAETGEEPPSRRIELTRQGRQAAAVSDSAQPLEPVSNQTVLKRLEALQDEAVTPADPAALTADLVQATAAEEGQAGTDEEFWRPTVWFNPWMYQSDEQVWAGLAGEIITQITRRMSPSERENFWLRLNLGRVDEGAVRRTVYGLVLNRMVPWAIGAAVAVVVGLALLAVHLTRWVTVSLAGGAPVLLALVTVVQSVRVGRAPVAGSLSWLVRPAGAAREAAAQATSQAVSGRLDTLMPDPGYAARAGFYSAVREDVQRVLDLVATPKRPLVVFVDDLDRCSPGTVVQVIEAINLFLAGEFPNSVFVIAMESAMVAAHLEAAYPDLAKVVSETEGTTAGSSLGWRFLEKIVQLPLTLPAMADGQQAAFTADQFGLGAGARTDWADAAAEVEGAPAADPVAKAVRDAVSSDEATSRAQARADAGSAHEASSDAPILLPESTVARDPEPPLDLQLRADDPAVRNAIEFAGPHLARNPREIKRFVNLFRFLVMIDSARRLRGLETLDGFQAVAKVALIQLHSPDLLAALGHYDNSHGFTICEMLEQVVFGQEVVGQVPEADELRESLEIGGLPAAVARRLTGPELMNILAAEPFLGPAVRPYL